MATAVENTTIFPTIDSLQKGVDDYFTLENSSWGVTALKVISYMTLVIPALMFAMNILLKCISKGLGLRQEVNILSPIQLPQALKMVIDATPQFSGYKIGMGTRFQGRTLTSFEIRPANLLFDILFGRGCTTMPGSRQLFQFTRPQVQLGNHIRQLAQEGAVIDLTARGLGGWEELYGPNLFRLSAQELQETLDSQRIYCASLLPRTFYQGLKAAMAQDNIVILPNVRVHQLAGHSGAFLQRVQQDPGAWGFRSAEHFQDIMNSTMYQLGSLVVKTEDFRILIDANGKIRARNPGDQDAIRLINACGIRNLGQTAGTPIPNHTIIKQMFSTAIGSAGNGYLVMPAVGMGVWGGDPALYWPALLDAIVEMNVPLEQIFINPGHQQNRGMNGNEFQQYLNQYLARYHDNPRALANLQKIVNLFDKKTDIVHFTQNLKHAFPDKIVSIFNASDPDVTLGYHVGEYVNNLGHASTTEENFTALGTNGLCFEGITGIHGHPERIIQVH